MVGAEDSDTAEDKKGGGVTFELYNRRTEKNLA